MAPECREELDGSPYRSQPLAQLRYCIINHVFYLLTNTSYQVDPLGGPLGRTPREQ